MNLKGNSTGKGVIAYVNDSGFKAYESEEIEYMDPNVVIVSNKKFDDDENDEFFQILKISLLMLI